MQGRSLHCPVHGDADDSTESYSYCVILYCRQHPHALDMTRNKLGVQRVNDMTCDWRHSHVKGCCDACDPHRTMRYPKKFGWMFHVWEGVVNLFQHV